MKIREAGKSMVAGFIVYVAMAACSATGTAPTGSNSGAGGHGGVGGHDGHGGSGPSGGGNSPAAGGAGSVGGYDAGEIWDALTDPVPDAAADPVSGSRLKAKYRVADDGSKEYLTYGWYDSQRQEDCSFNTASDGIQRCMPAATILVQPHFLDAACSQPLVEVGVSASCSAPPPPKYANLYAPDPVTCAYTIHIRPVLAPVNPVNVYSLIGANCTKVAPTAGTTYYSTGPEMAPTSFVGSTVMHD